MAATRSSSVPSTPAAKTAGVTVTTPHSTPRKVPHCTKCHRPRAGHPRQGCPYVGSPASAKEEEHIADVLGSLHIEPSAQDPKARQLRRSSVIPTSIPEASLETLNTDTSALLDGLLRPGMMDNKVSEDERIASVTRWQNLVATPTKSKKTSPRMPGTLHTPSTTKSSLDSDDLSSHVVGVKEPLQPTNEEKKPLVRMPGAMITPSITRLKMEPTSIDLVATHETSTTSEAGSASANKLMRSMSLEEREKYLNNLATTSKAPPATVFVLPMDEIPQQQRHATELGFHCRVHDLENGEGWFIVGMDGQAVEDLFAGVEAEKNASGGEGFGSAVRGAIAGSVGTWMVLAYA